MIACPKCKSIHPPSTRQCSCGYDFVLGSESFVANHAGKLLLAAFAVSIPLNMLARALRQNAAQNADVDMAARAAQNADMVSVLAGLMFVILGGLAVAGYIKRR